MSSHPKGKTVVIVQARMGSTRLPGKVLKTVLGKPLLSYLLERLQEVSLADEVVIATTVKEIDHPIAALCQTLSVPVYRGPEEDVLARYFGAAQQFKAKTIVRITSDCPLIDPGIVNSVIHQFHTKGLWDYLSTAQRRYLPLGMDAEIFSAEALEQAFHGASKPFEREHVTPFIYRNPALFQIGSMPIPDHWDLDEATRHRLTVDTPEDFDLVSRILQTLAGEHSRFSLRDILDLMAQHPEWSQLNAHIQQKSYKKS